MGVAAASARQRLTPAAQAVAAFCAERRIEALLVMTAVPTPSFARGLLVAAPGDPALEERISTALLADDELKLSPAGRDGDEGIRVFTQAALKSSRKKVMPKVAAILAEA